MWKQPLKWNDSLTYECPSCMSLFPNTESNNGIECDCSEGGTICHPLRPKVFCASLSDWLDEEVPKEWLYRLLDLIQCTPNLDWLLLTKRPENFRMRLKESMNQCSDRADDFIDAWLEGDPPLNVWMGTSVENQAAANARIPFLLKIPAKVRFLSCEPLLGPVLLDDGCGSWLSCTNCQGEDEVETGADVDCCESFHDHGKHFHGVDWVIAGGESGPKARKMHPDWARSLRDQCEEARLPFLFKQWGGVNKKATGRILDGRTWDEFPV